ncbi:hypothetical protein D7Z54_20205 [Salibacterium salarium]|uniref:Uncharacterized protein n=1 Tax=Salibacterium salarium TaxID=284579 RepID=A0A3R9P5F5_9BACI|nr:hypothetical protein [Salibacterium salarium]RSL31562.1 hypothetical protein D7Z54_20205 [Salibacterium salarium]
MSNDMDVHEIARQLTAETAASDKQEIKTLIKEARSKKGFDITSDVLIPSLLKMREQDRQFTIELIQRCLKNS